MGFAKLGFKPRFEGFKDRALTDAFKCLLSKLHDEFGSENMPSSPLFELGNPRARPRSRRRARRKARAARVFLPTSQKRRLSFKLTRRARERERERRGSNCQKVVRVLTNLKILRRSRRLVGVLRLAQGLVQCGSGRDQEGLLQTGARVSPGQVFS